MINLNKIIIAFTLATGLAGCATIFSGSNQTINIKIVDAKSNEDLNDFSCHVTDGTGTRKRITTSPSAVVVQKAKGAINIDCTKAGYSQQSVGIGESFNAVTFVNVLFWPGFIVDAVSGAYKEYPSHYVVIMDKK